MEALHSLIKNLSVEEYSIVEKHLGYLNTKVGQAQITKLFELLSKDRVVSTEKDYSKRIYGKISLDKLYTIKSRLKSRMLEALISDIAFDKTEKLDILDKVSIRLRKKMVQLRMVYWTQGNQLIVNELLDEILRSAYEFEIHDILVDALQFKKSLIGFREGTDAYNKIVTELERSQTCLKAILNATAVYNEYLTIRQFNAENKIDLTLTKLNDSISALSESYLLTNSRNVQYFLKELETEYLEIKGEFVLAREKIIEQLNNLKTFKSISRRLRIGICYSNLSYTDILLKEYKTSFKNSIQAQSFMMVNSFNFLLCERNKFYASFYSRNIVNAESSVLVMRNHMKRDQGEFNGAIYDFFYANLLFIKGEYTEALKVVSQNLEISHDKSGWDIALRVLTIMCQVELGQEDQATHASEALRKHVQRTSKKNSLKERDVVIVKVIQQLEKNGFSLSSISSNDITGLEKISLDNTALTWKPFTPELIPFHEWVYNKLSKPSRVLKKHHNKFYDAY